MASIVIYYPAQPGSRVFSVSVIFISDYVRLCAGAVPVAPAHVRGLCLWRLRTCGRAAARGGGGGAPRGGTALRVPMNTYAYRIHVECIKYTRVHNIQCTAEYTNVGPHTSLGCAFTTVSLPYQDANPHQMAVAKLWLMCAHL